MNNVRESAGSAKGGGTRILNRLLARELTRDELARATAGDGGPRQETQTLTYDAPGIPGDVASDIG